MATMPETIPIFRGRPSLGARPVVGTLRQEPPSAGGRGPGPAGDPGPLLLVIIVENPTTDTYPVFSNSGSPVRGKRT